MNNKDIYKKIWNKLKSYGYESNDDIPYIEITQICDELDVDIDTIDIEEFSEKYNVEIG